jgi:dCTP deaminase
MTAPSVSAASRRSGILPSQAIAKLIESGGITATQPIPKGQIQPASLDLRLGPIAHRVRASFLPGPGASVMARIEQLGMHSMDLRQGAVLERGCVYIVPLLESLDLPKAISGAANPKSSTGRLDIFTRMIADGVPEFDRVPAGYAGPLYAEISPRTFSIVAREGDRLSQIRFRRGNPPASDSEMRALHDRDTLVHGVADADIAKGVAISVDLSGEAGNGNDGLVGYRAKHHSAVIDLGKIGHYEKMEFWEPIFVRAGRAGGTKKAKNSIILNPDDFYILASAEPVSVPPDYAAELVPYDALVGEFRVHYAGFFDPGFGYTGVRRKGTRAVLEVRSRDVPFVLEHGQIVGRLAYERLTEPPDILYGTAIGSSYGRQGLALSKHFK